jgi:hypothetical protein
MFDRSLEEIALEAVAEPSQCLRIRESCGPMLGGGVHICSDSETLAGFGNCFKRNFLKALIF